MKCALQARGQELSPFFALITSASIPSFQRPCDSWFIYRSSSNPSSAPGAQRGGRHQEGTHYPLTICSLFTHYPLTICSEQQEPQSFLQRYVSRIFNILIYLVFNIRSLIFSAKQPNITAYYSHNEFGWFAFHDLHIEYPGPNLIVLQWLYLVIPIVYLLLSSLPQEEGQPARKPGERILNIRIDLSLFMID